MTVASSALGVIPARANSSRFPNKVVAKIQGHPMIWYAWSAARKASRLSRVLVATDSEKVAEVARGFGAECILTPDDLASGTDRVAWVTRNLDAPIIVNLQGDEPLLPPDAIDRLVSELEKSPQFDMATLAVRKTTDEDRQSPHVVKVVMDTENRALYFSRQPLLSGVDGHFFKHIGIYAYRREALQRLCQLPPSPLELTERLEQLRALENGLSIKVVVINRDTIAVDIPSDITKVENFLSGVPL